jgi:PIN domain nuclease of toxin-antitoxin system
VVASVVSAWEIVIKLGTGKLTVDRPVAELWYDALIENDFEPLGVSAEHVFALEPFPPHHRDPFDRPLIAQALAEDLQIVSADAAFDEYPVQRIW